MKYSYEHYLHHPTLRFFPANPTAITISEEENRSTLKNQNADYLARFPISSNVLRILDVSKVC